MDPEILIKSFRAERADRDPQARARARAELGRKFEAATDADSTPIGHPPRGPALALAGALVLVVVVAAVLVLSSGSRTETAAAEVLHEAARIAASGEDTAGLHASPGQYYFVRTRTRELIGWYPGGYSIPGAPASRPGGFSALIPTETRTWTSPQGGGRLRETMATPEFRSSAERDRWKHAGSPLPIGFEPRHDKKFEEEEKQADHKILQSSRGVLDFETVQPESGPQIYPDLSSVPTEPKELRRAIGNHEVPGVADEAGRSTGVERSIEALGTLLSRPNASPELRAAAFNALAETPGVELNREASDLIGRSGYAVSYAPGDGKWRTEFIFDPRTSSALGEREVLLHPVGEPQWKGYGAGFTVRDVAFLRSKVVDSTHEPTS